jgi:transketolase
VCSSEPLDEKFRSFGWEVIGVAGHDFAELTAALTQKPAAGKPTCVIARTVKGRGVSFMADVVKWHHGVPSQAELDQALAELDAAELELLGARP